MKEEAVGSNALVRPWTIEDIDAVLAIQSVSPGAAMWDRAAYEKLLDLSPPNCGCVAESDGRVVGFASFRVIAPDAELLNLAVLPSHRRAGIGYALLDFVRGSSSVIGASLVYLEVRESNTAAIALYRRLGFDPIGRRKAYYSDPAEDALTFRLMLSSTFPGQPEIILK